MRISNDASAKHMISLYKKIKTIFWDSLHGVHPEFHGFVFRYRIYVKYIFAGGTAATIDLVLLALFVEIFGFHYLFASALAFIVAFFVSFTLQKFWTFGNTVMDAIRRQLAVYFGIAVFNLLLNTLLMYVLVDIAQFWYFGSQIVVCGFVAVISFMLYRRFVFNSDRPLTSTPTKADDTAAESGLKKKANLFYSPYFMLAVVVLTLYIPFWFHTLDLRREQIAQGRPEVINVPFLGSDSIGYRILADNIIDGGGCSTETTPPYRPDTFRTPGYPLFVALTKVVFRTYDAVALIQMLFVIATAWLIYEIGKKLWSSGVGMAAALFYIFYPNTIFQTLYVISETLFVFLFLLAVYLLFLKERGSPAMRLFLGGVVLGIATLTRPMALYLIVPFALFLVYQTWSRRLPVKKIFASVAILILSFTAVVMPWLVRNKEVSGVWGLSSVGDFNYFHYIIPEYISYTRGIAPDEARLELFGKLGLVSSDEIADLKHSPLLRSILMSYVYAEPLRYAEFHLLKTIPFFLSSSVENIGSIYYRVLSYRVFDISSSNKRNLLGKGDFRALFAELRAHPVVFGEELALLFIAILAFSAIFLKRTRPFVLLFLFIILYFALLTGAVAYARLRMPVEPFLFLLAAASFSATIGLLWNKKRVKLAER